jgi:hypothetical protein
MAAGCGLRQTLNVGAGQALDALRCLAGTLYRTCVPNSRVHHAGKAAARAQTQGTAPKALNRNDVAEVRRPPTCITGTFALPRASTAALR